jgi:hypothetical protein
MLVYLARDASERIRLKCYEGELRQVTVTDLGHEEPTVLLTKNFAVKSPTLVTRYAQRTLIENGILEANQFFHLDALSSRLNILRQSQNCARGW